MKIITIGREQGNDIVINDANVSRKHLELVCDAQSNVRLKDLGSKNGTFVNGARVSETYLMPGDKVKIGDTTLPWQSYFPPVSAPTPVQAPPPPPPKKTNGKSVIKIILSAIPILATLIALLDKCTNIFKKS